MNLYSIFKLILLTSAMGATLTVIVMLIKTLFKDKLSPTWHYYIWFLVIIRLLLPYSPSSNFSVFNLFQFSKEQINMSSKASIEKMPSLNINTITKVEGNSNDYKEEKITNNDDNSNDSNIISTSAKESAENKIKFSLNLETLSLLWIIGILIISCYIFTSYFIFRIKVSKESQCKDIEVINLLEKCKSTINIKRKVPIVYSYNIKTPTLCGIFKPKILISKNIIENLTSDEKRYIFLHELSHLKRKDILFNWIFTLLIILHWFNPLLWFAFNRMKKDCELSCDALTLTYISPEEYKHYGETLIKLVNIFSFSKWKPGTTAMANKSEIKRRIIMISKFKKKSFLASIIAIAVTLALGCAGLTNSKAASQKDVIESNKVNNTITSDSSDSNTKEVDVTSDSINIKDTKEVEDNSKVESTSSKEPNKVTTTEVKKSEYPSISDEDILTLLSNGYKNVIKLESLTKVYQNPIQEYGKLPGHNEDTYHTYAKIEGQSFKTLESISQYLNQQLNLDKYFTKDFSEKFVSFVTTEINGEYYMLLGNFGMRHDIKNGTIESKKAEGNKLYVNFTPKPYDEDTITFNAALVYNGEKWIIDKMEGLSIPILAN